MSIVIQTCHTHHFGTDWLPVDEPKIYVFLRRQFEAKKSVLETLLLKTWAAHTYPNLLWASPPWELHWQWMLCVVIFGCTYCVTRGVRGNRQKTRKNSVKLGKNAKNRLKITEKAEILAQENFQKRGNQLERGTLTPLVTHVLLAASAMSYIWYRAGLEINTR